MHRKCSLIATFILYICSLFTIAEQPKCACEFCELGTSSRELSSHINFTLSFSLFDRYHHNYLGPTKTEDQLKAKSVPLCSVNDVQLRFLCPDDLEEVRTLCQDWFPIDYPLSWYEDITSSTRFFALAAVYNLTIIGLIVAEIKPFSKLNKEVRPLYLGNVYTEYFYRVPSNGVTCNTF